MITTADVEREATSDAGFWRRLLHRWFIEYNPFYIVSAGCVLVGVDLISSALARAGSAYGQIGVVAIAEFYSWALVAAAAWLTRTGSRRPAVMLALLVVLYQGDPTLHTETCAHLGAIGDVAAALWLASFVGKLCALAGAVRLRLSRSAIAVPTLGALGLLILPRYLHRLDASSMTAFVAVWAFSLFACGLWSVRSVTSKVALDAWGDTVLRRGLRATWLIWSLLWLSHVLFWIDDYDLKLGVLIPVALLLSTRWLRGEIAVWGAVSGTLVFVATRMPGFFWIAALLAAVVLALRAVRRPVYVAAVSVPLGPNAPYRTTSTEAPPAEPSAPTLTFALAGPRALVRLATGSAVALYLSVWTIGWSGGAWPAHVIWLDALLTAVVALSIWKRRNWLGYVPLAATYFHLGVQTRIISAPASTLQWGISFVGLGFGLLVASLLVTWRLRKRGARGCVMREALS